MTRQQCLKNLLMGKPYEANERVTEWLLTHKPLLSPSISSLVGRRLNHFLVGSDPEFCLVWQGRQVSAYNANLKVGLAAGCDQNERLVELRPAPSASVVEHVAGILTDLRWLWRTGNNTIAASHWRAGAWFGGDGLGGHVHFGRKRPTRPQEVAALDGLSNAFRLCGIFSRAEWDRRQVGDNLGQHYGMPGDFRLQRHGYEYRSLPSWLNSPTVAFISIAASKLTVLDPELTTGWQPRDSAAARYHLRALAKYFKSRDDDAYILYHLLTAHEDLVFAVDHAADFAPAWGIPKERPEGAASEESLILPSCIHPHPDEIAEVYDHLLHGAPLRFREYAPNFVCTLPGKDFQWVPGHTHPGRRSGYGDLIHNLVTHRDYPIRFEHANTGQIRVEGHLPNLWSPDELATFRRYAPHAIITPNPDYGFETRLLVTRDYTQTNTIAGLRAILLSGMFPIWTVETVQPKSHIEWEGMHHKISKPKWRSY